LAEIDLCQWSSRPLFVLLLTIFVGGFIWRPSGGDRNSRRKQIERGPSLTGVWSRAAEFRGTVRRFRQGRIVVSLGHGGVVDLKERFMRPRSPVWYLAPLAACLLLSAAAQAQVIPFSGNFGPGLSPEDNRLLFESVARLNEAEPSQVGRSEAWSNPQTKSHGTSTILKVFDSDGMTCHLVRHRIVAERPPSRNYRLTWCRTASGEWKIKG
jgi:hypothetical protein